MIRLIVECHEFDANVGIERKDYTTLDVDLPKLEALLKRGEKGPMGFETWRLIGVEVLPANSGT